MAYRCKIEEPIAKGIRRVVREQAERAEQRLAEANGGPAGIHEARKHLKRARALLRLVRPVLGDGLFHRENARFREIGLLLAGARDLDVLEQTVAALKSGCRQQVPGSAFEALSASLAAAREEAEANGMAERRDKALAMLRQAKDELAALKMRKGGFELVAEGLRRTYRSCRRAFRTAYAVPSDQNFHDWRKTVQHHWRQMILLSSAWPEVMKARAAAAKELSEILGLDHDLALLKAHMESGAGAALSARDRDRLANLCCLRQKVLRAQAHPRGARLLAEKTGAFCARIEGYWQEAARIAALEAREEGPQPQPRPAQPRRGGKAGAQKQG